MSANSDGSEVSVALQGDDGEKPPPKLPRVVFACAAAVVLAALSFTAMTSMCGLVWLNLFNYGPTELGLFLTCFGSKTPDASTRKMTMFYLKNIFLLIRI